MAARKFPLAATMVPSGLNSIIACEAPIASRVAAAASAAPWVGVAFVCVVFVVMVVGFPRPKYGPRTAGVVS
jgi:hypothetical protein